MKGSKMINMNVSKNRLWNVKNPNQGEAVKVLCVCSAGLLRSPTIARWLCRNFDNVNPRACGTSESYALIPVDRAMIEWSDIVICADSDHYEFMTMTCNYADIERPLFNLQIPDDFNFGSPDLEAMIAIRVEELEIFKVFDNNSAI
jgi:predicted protein tyrosine phosphatase